MIPQEVADVRDIFTKQFGLSSDVATKMAWALYEAKLLKQQ